MSSSNGCAFIMEENTAGIKELPFLINMTQLEGGERLTSTFHF